MQSETAILIIGGGLAGLTAALHLQKAGLDVTVIEKMSYPQHKVCGEYVSNEVFAYLRWLDADPRLLSAPEITDLQLSTAAGICISTKLPLGGYGISRYYLDHFLFQKFLERGGRVIQDNVKSVIFNGEQFSITTQSDRQFSAQHVIGAYGKRAGIDLSLKRAFIEKKSPFLAVKAHYAGAFPSHVVGLHYFNGGYCGVSKVEDQKINICYLADYRSFKQYKNVAAYQTNVLYQNKLLKAVFEQATPLFETPLSVSQLAFGPREIVKNHILMIGDTAGLIHPLCGNGMSMAIHSAKICTELLISFFEGRINSRTVLENLYVSSWKKQFRSRLNMTAVLSSVLSKPSRANVLLNGLGRFPALLPFIIKKTHGENLIPGK